MKYIIILCAFLSFSCIAQVEVKIHNCLWNEVEVSVQGQTKNKKSQIFFVGENFSGLTRVQKSFPFQQGKIVVKFSQTLQTIARLRIQITGQKEQVLFCPTQNPSAWGAFLYFQRHNNMFESWIIFFICVIVHRSDQNWRKRRFKTDRNMSGIHHSKTF